MKGLLFACGLLATTVSAHIQMVEPIPIRSPESKDKSGKIDYSYTNPLSDSGSDYPCKGYANDPFKSVANYSPGQSYNLKLKGSATHEGGSCQISLSYDKGKSFKVIHSMLGGCPITQEYQFQIPQGAPSGEALLAWTWFNKVGNREMYMNCAQVTIGGGGGGGGGNGGNQRQAKEEKAITRRDGLDSLPPMFIANVDGPGKCKTIEGEDVNFPMPGQSVEGKASGKGFKCEGSAPFLGGGSSNGPNAPEDNKNKNDKNDKNNNDNKSNNDNINNNDNKNSNENKNNKNTNDNNNKNENKNNDNQKNKPSTENRTHKELVHKVAMPFGDNKDGNMRTASAGTQNSPSWLLEAEGCNGNDVICAPDGQTWALCNNGKPVHMGNVAAGTTCTHGAMQHAAMQPVS